MSKKAMVLILALVGLVAFITAAASVKAGGWATVGVTQLPQQIYAQQPFTIEFMVWQHGNKPVHELAINGREPQFVKPRIILMPADGSAALTVMAQPLAKLGLFTAEITLPAAGEWHWRVEPDPLEGVSEFETLNVLPPQPETTVPSTLRQVLTLAGAGLPLWGVLGAIGLLLAVFLAYRAQATSTS
jgi:hypothetical protein